MANAKSGPLAPIVKREGTALKPTVVDRILGVRITRGTGLVGRATLRFNDTGYALSASDTFALGTQLTIAEPGEGVLFEGTITGITLEQIGGGLPEIVVVADDAAYKLARGTEVATYLNGTYASVLQKIARRHGLRPKIDPSSLTVEYLLQAGTDLAFLDTVADRLGLAWWVEDKATLVVTKLKPGPLAATVTLGEQLREFSVRASGLRPTAVSVHGWDPDQQQNVTDTNPSTPNGRAPALLSSYVGTSPAGKLTAAATAVADRRPLSADEAKVLAGACYDEWAAAAVVARGTMDADSRVKPGATIRVNGAGPVAGNYVVSSVEHVFDRRGFVTRFATGSRRPAGLVDTLGRDGPDPGFAMAGVVVGVVTDANDPDSTGRVKVRYTGIAGEVESPWARVVALGGGNARGAIFHPEVKDEVLVAFEHNDTRRPVVIGGLHSKRNTLPTGSNYVTDGKVNYRRITSRKNHMIELADGDGPEQEHILLLVGTAAHKLRLGADRFDIEVAEGKPVTIKAGSAKFDISTSGDVTIEGNNITVKAKTALNLEAGAAATLKGNSKASMHGGQVEVKADATASVEASGPLTLKGAMVAIN